MTANAKYTTPQEDFWAGNFGSDYISRNNSPELLASNLNFFSKALQRGGKITSCLEFGANIGMNMTALKLLYPHINMKAVEINPEAAKVLKENIGVENVFEGSILEYSVTQQEELVLLKGVLIHMNPQVLSKVYEIIYRSSARLILLAEYYNPTPVAISYRGHSDRLFKRDFAGEILEIYSDMKLLDYGFSYRRDPSFPQDDINWFLLEKGA